MAEHAWTVLCHKVLVDPDAQILSLIDVVEKFILHQPDGQSVEQQFEKARQAGRKGLKFDVDLRLVSYWVRSEYSRPEQSEMRIVMHNPTGEKLWEQVVSIELKKPAQRIILRMEQLQVSTFGRYWITVERPAKSGKKDSWVTVAKLPLELVTEEVTTPPEA